MSSSKDGWPSYLPGPIANIFPLGVITLNYGQLENIFACIFAAVIGLEMDKSQLIFQKIRNDSRRTIIQESIPDNFRLEVIECIEHFLKAFNVCALNRHDILHSHMGGIYGHPSGAALVLTKTTRAGKRLCCAPSASDLQEIADAMHSLVSYGAFLTQAIIFESHNLTEQRPPTPLPELLNETPSIPRSLRWRLLPTHQNERFPPPPYLE